MSQPLRIAVLSDGKPGHLNQSLGLAEAISRRQAAQIETTSVRRRQIFPGKLESQPDLILGAGHAVHIPMLLLARQTGSPTVVLMKPSLPSSWFSLCVVPEHDLEGKECPPRTIPTEGALNRVGPPDDTPRRDGLILLGGPSAHHGWDGPRITSCIANIVQSSEEVAWKITDSRRTPDGTLEQLKDSVPGLEIFPHTSTGPDWLPQELGRSAQTWVSEDSISMIYEALSSGTRVGLLPVPQTHPNHRVIKGVKRLIQSKLICPFDQWTPGPSLPAPVRILREADRVAGLILDKLKLQQHPGS